MELHSVYVVGDARTDSNNAITKRFVNFFLVFEVEDETGTILDFGCSHTVGTTERFLSKLFLNENFFTIGDRLPAILERRYGGSSCKAILVAYRDAVKRYNLMVR